MTCHKLNELNFATRWWHRLRCQECRRAQHLDTMVGFGLMQMKTEPFAATGMESALSLLNLQEGGREVRRAARRMAVRRMRRQARTAGIALVVGGVWWQYMNYIPPIRIPAKAVPPQNAFDYFKAAGKMLPPTKDKISSVDTEMNNMLEESRQLRSDPPTRKRRDARLKGQGKPLPSLSELRKTAAHEGLTVTLDGIRLSAEASPDVRAQISDKIKMPYTREEKREILADGEAALAKLREGLKYPYMDVYPRRFDALFPYYSQFRQMARMLSLEADVKAAAGDWNGAMQSSLDAIQMGVDIGHGGPLIGRLVGIACEAIGQQGAWKALQHLNGKQAKEATARLQAIRANHAPFVETMQEEKWFMQEGLRSQMRKPGWRADFYALTGNSESKSFAFMMMGWSNRVILKDIGSVMDENIRRCRLPYAQSSKMEEVKEPFDPIVQIMFPIFAQAQYKDVYVSETQSALLVTALALRAYQTEHEGRLPNHLEQLTPRYLAQVPADPFANGNAPLQYRKMPNWAVWDKIMAAARSNEWQPNLRGTLPYTLYSVGPDGRDDDGNPVDGVHPRSDSSDSWHPKVAPNDKNRFAVQPDSKGDIVAGVNMR